MSATENRKLSEVEFGFSSDDFDAEQYADAARRAKLINVALTKQSYEAKLPVYWTGLSDDDLTHQFGGECVRVSLDIETGKMGGGYRWEASLRHGRKIAVKLTNQYFLMYGGLIGVEERYARLYFSKIARFTSYPYFRSAFAIATSSSGILMNPLPSLTDRVD
jgi:hypothetical protein